MSEFTSEEESVLSNFVTNTNKDVFCLINLPEVVKGALFSRYSRNTKSLRRLLLDEFITKKEVGLSEIIKQNKDTENIIATQKAENFYERILLGFGDDSIAELAGVHVALENISNIATKFIEDSRIGLSPLEKSTRYIYFDQKKEGKYLYYREPAIMNSEFSKIYIETCDKLFDTYASLIPKMSKFFEERYPKTEDLSERTYTSTIRAKTCDVLRGLLPASTLTNMGIFANARALEYLLTKMYASELDEIKKLALVLHDELRVVIPAFVRGAEDKYRKAQQEYISKTRSSVSKISNQFTENYSNQKTNETVLLTDYDKNGEKKVLSAILYSNSNISMQDANKIAHSLSPEKAQAILKAYVGERENRRHKPYRAFENTYYTFDICANFGAYRDMQRHRIATQERQLLGVSLGYDIPKEIIEAGFENEFKNAMDNAKANYELISKKMPKQAQYIVPFAYKLRWYITMNLREAYHIIELRSVQQGHTDYRKIAQEMYNKINSVHPALACGMKFVDMKEYALERLEAEKKIDKKLKELTY